MDKQVKAFADLMKQVFTSPFEQACRDWRETTKQIKRERVRCNKCGQPVKAKSAQERQLWNERRRELYKWKVRAKAVGIPMLPAHRPIKSVREEWEHRVVESELETVS